MRRFGFGAQAWRQGTARRRLAAAAQTPLVQGRLLLAGPSFARFAGTQPKPAARLGPSGAQLAGASAAAAAIGFGCWQLRGSQGADEKRGPRMTADQASRPENPHVFLDIQVGSSPAKRVEIELFAGICPKTAENFRCLCTGEKGRGRSGRPLHFKGSYFHRVIPGFMCQGGDYTVGNGTGGESIYGSMFPDEFENGVIVHSCPMLLSMANRGRNTNGSQFFLTVAPTPHLDGKHVVFGRVVAGQEVVKAVEAVGSDTGTTRRPVQISDCGELPRPA